MYTQGELGRGGGIRTPKNGFGDRRFTVEPTPLFWRFRVPVYPGCIPGRTAVTGFAEASYAELLGFPVRVVLSAVRAELLHFKTASGGLLVLGARVVPVLALGALERNDFSWHFLLLPGLASNVN
jgi:hypothetical protein